MTYLFAAYSIILLAIFGYLLTLGRRQKGLEADICLLREALQLGDKQRSEL